jgi:hypothetical protein
VPQLQLTGAQEVWSVEGNSLEECHKNTELREAGYIVIHGRKFEELRYYSREGFDVLILSLWANLKVKLPV